MARIKRFREFTMVSTREDHLRRLFLNWLWLTIVGWYVGYSVAGLLVNRFLTSQIFPALDFASLREAAVSVVGYLIWSVFQWIALRDELDDAWMWIAATLTGAGVAAVINVAFIDRSIAPLVEQAIAGRVSMPDDMLAFDLALSVSLNRLISILSWALLVSFFQWLVLRIDTPRAGKWVSVVAIGATLQFLTGSIFYMSITTYLALTSFEPEQWPNMSIFVVIAEILDFAAIVIFTIMTGIGLVVLRQEIDSASPVLDDVPIVQSGGV